LMTLDSKELLKDLFQIAFESCIMVEYVDRALRGCRCDSLMVWDVVLYTFCPVFTFITKW
jgi:hypothetical protein